MGVANKRTHSPQFKLDVAIKALESKQYAETARAYGLNTGQVSKWISYLKSQGSTIFANHPDKEKAALLAKIEKLEHLIGKKEIELSLIKNFIDFTGSPSGK